MENVRELILDILLTLEREGGYSNQLIRDVLDKYDYLERTKKAFIKRVCEGTIERRIELDDKLNQISSTPVSKMKPFIRCLLRMSLYQILYMDQVPDSAVCNEAVKLAVKRKFGNLKGYVNGVLRTAVKKKDSFTLPDKENREAYLSVKYSMPSQVLALLKQAYGWELTEEILEALLAVHPVCVRLPLGMKKEDRDAVVREMEKTGGRCLWTTYRENQFFLENADNLSRLQSFTQGKCTVQDVSSALAVDAAGVKQGDIVIDACSAPGGKAVMAAEYAGERGQVYAFDISEGKCGRIEENAKRMHLDTISVGINDARTPRKELFGKTDVLLLDVPCSGLGIMGKKRDIKYHFEPENLPKLYGLQRDIVEKSLAYLKPGGTLLYSTCTLNPAENQEMVEWILTLPGMEQVSIRDSVPDRLWLERSKVIEKLEAVGAAALRDNSVLCLPGVMEMDGFFFAKFRKRKGEEG